MELTHFNDEGRARMVDVTEKPQTIRIARAAATVNMCAETMQMLRSGGMKRATCSPWRRSRESWQRRKTAS